MQNITTLCVSFSAGILTKLKYLAWIKSKIREAKVKSSVPSEYFYDDVENDENKFFQSFQDCIHWINWLISKLTTALCSEWAKKQIPNKFFYIDEEENKL